MYQAWRCGILYGMRIIGGAAVLAAVVVLAGCSAAGSPSPAVTTDDGHLPFFAHTESLDRSAYEKLGYGNAVCADLVNADAHTKQDVSLRILALTNIDYKPFTVDDATTLANAAVTYLCPQFAPLAHV